MASPALKITNITVADGPAACEVHVYPTIGRVSVSANLAELRAFLRGEEAPAIRQALEATGLLDPQTGFCTRCHMTEPLDRMHPTSGYCLGCTLPEDLERDGVDPTLDPSFPATDAELDQIFGPDAPPAPLTLEQAEG